ncbi:hypothetical protein [Methanopyrus sp.]
MLEAPDDVEVILERDSWVVRKFWVFTAGLGDPTPAELIRFLREAAHDWDEKTRVSSDVPNPPVDAVVPHGLPYSTRFKYWDLDTPSGSSLWVADVIVGTRSTQPAPVLRSDEFTTEGLLRRLVDRYANFYTVVRICPVRTLGLPERVGAVLPGLLLLAQVLTGHLPTNVNWYANPEWYPDASHITLTLKRLKVRGPFHVGFPTERTVNAQVGWFSHIHYTQLISYLGDRERNPLPRPPAPGFPHALLRAYGAVTGVDPFDTERWERESGHPHGPAASLATTPDLELKPGESEKLAEGLLKLHDALSGLEASGAPDVEAVVDAALELLHLAYGVTPP